MDVHITLLPPNFLDFEALEATFNNQSAVSRSSYWSVGSFEERVKFFKYSFRSIQCIRNWRCFPIQ